MLATDARKSIATVMARLRPFVERRVAMAADVDDVLQDVLLRMHRGLPALRDSDRFGPWIYRLVRNAITDHYRAQGRDGKPAGKPTEASQAASEDETDAAQGLAVCIAPFVARLPSPYREAITLVDLEGVAHKDAAPMLGVSLPGVKARVQRGRKQLRAMFDECCRLDLDVRHRVVDYQCRPGKGSGAAGAC